MAMVTESAPVWLNVAPGGQWARYGNRYIICIMICNIMICNIVMGKIICNIIGPCGGLQAHLPT
jgi:hypothetical protein